MVEGWAGWGDVVGAHMGCASSFQLGATVEYAPDAPLEAGKSDLVDMLLAVGVDAGCSVLGPLHNGGCWWWASAGS